ncbi:MAG: TlpA family protein disulfide reductase [Aquaticitalea sp.]
MRFPIFLLLTLSTLLGCDNSSNGENSYIYFGGEIINPNNNYVVLIDPDEKSDTLYLNDQNRFLKKLTNAKAGMYTFTHGEYQRILLEPNDSLMVRLNTMDFDESLVFTGEGARKNNYLIAAFLEKEIDNKKFLRMMWDTEPAKFEEALNADRTIKLQKLEDFLFKKSYSDLFKTIAESNINYDYYYYKELYPFSYYGYNNLIHYKDLPQDFYDFRDKADYNSEELIGVNPYYRFLFFHFNNLALVKYYENASHNVVFNSKSALYNLEKLRLMDSLVDNKKIKNHLLKSTTRDFIVASEDSSEIREISNSFLKKSSSDSDKEYIKNLVNAVERLQPGNELPPINLISYDDKEVMISDLISKPTIIYFWSSNLPVLSRNIHYKVNSLKTRYPEVDFIAINISDDDTAHWKNMLNKYKFATSDEYRFQNLKESLSSLVINSVNRSIFVGSDGKIRSSNAMIFTHEFEDELDHYLHTKKAHQ